jgi:hypothetical protein
MLVPLTPRVLPEAGRTTELFVHLSSGRRRAPRANETRLSVPVPGDSQRSVSIPSLRGKSPSMA